GSPIGCCVCAGWFVICDGLGRGDDYAGGIEIESEHGGGVADLFGVNAAAASEWAVGGAVRADDSAGGAETGSTECAGIVQDAGSGNFGNRRVDFGGGGGGVRFCDEVGEEVGRGLHRRGRGGRGGVWNAKLSEMRPITARRRWGKTDNVFSVVNLRREKYV